MKTEEIKQYRTPKEMGKKKNRKTSKRRNTYIENRWSEKKMKKKKELLYIYVYIQIKIKKKKIARTQHFASNIYNSWVVHRSSSIWRVQIYLFMYVCVCVLLLLLLLFSFFFFPRFPAPSASPIASLLLPLSLPETRDSLNCTVSACYHLCNARPCRVQSDEEKKAKREGKGALEVLC